MSCIKFFRTFIRTQLFVFFLLPSVLASTGQTRGDSLWIRWNDADVEDSLRLEAIHELAKKIMLYQRPDSAFTLARLQLAFARSVESYRYAGEALNTQGISWAIRGDMNKAMDYFEQALRAFEDGKLHADVASALYNIGNVHANLGQEELALEYMQRSLDLSRQTGNFRAVIRALHGFGRYHEGKGLYTKALSDYQQALAISDSIGDDQGTIFAQRSMANVSKLQGNQARAIDLLSEALKRAEAIEDRRNISYCLDDIGNLYDRQGEPEKALEYYRRGLEISEETQDKEGMVRSLINLGNAYSSMGAYAESVAQLEESLALATEMNDRKSMGIICNNLGMAKAEMGELASGLETCLKGLALKEQVGFEKGLSNSYLNIGTILLKSNRYEEASYYSNKALALAEESGSAPEIRDASYDLYKIYNALDRPREALTMLNTYIITKDSIARIENQRALLRQEYKYSYEKQALADSLEFAKKEAIKDLEIQKRDVNLAKQRIGLGASGGGLLLLILLVYSIRRGKKRSDELLHNILPEEVASELKTTGSAQSKRIEQVSVLFTDFKGFSAMSEQLSPGDLVNELNDCFSAFDEITTRYGIEKIKTIGDAYMAAGGLPTPNNTHAVDVVKAALDMRDFVERSKQEKLEKGLPFFELRIGIHTGPVVAGIVGMKKFQYDIWGDTVNTASRMESSGEVGRVNISQTTFELVQDEFKCEYRGEIEAKGKGKLKMYFVQRR